MPHDAVADRPARRCAACGADLRFSHREYAGRGLQAAVWRCTSCGRSVRDQARSRAPAASPPRRDHAPVDDGPPHNPVIDPETARRVLGREPDEA